MCARFGAGIRQGEHAKPRSGMRQRTLETRCGLAQVEHVLARSFQNRGNEGCCSHTQMLTSVHKRGVDNNVQDGSANERGVFLISIPLPPIPPMSIRNIGRGRHALGAPLLDDDQNDLCVFGRST